MTGLRLRSYTGTITLGPLLRVLKLFMGILMQERMRRESIGILCLQNAYRAQTNGHRLTTAAHKPGVVIEQATSSYSFRFPELSQPI